MEDYRFYELATKVLSKEASEDEKELLAKYLDESEYRMLYAWLESEIEKGLTSNFTEFNYERGLNLLRKKIRQDSEVQMKKKTLLRFVVGIAASFLLVIGLGMFWSQWTKTNGDRQVKYISYSTQMGERKAIRLADGTVVHLNVATSLSVPEKFSANERRVKLKGEAFFDVARNPAKPFIVQTGNFRTTVLGTHFNVSYNQEKTIEVTVESGKVRVENVAKNQQVLLLKDERTMYSENQNGFSKTAVNSSIYTDWRNNVLRFDGITTQQAFDKIEKWYNVRIHCSSSQILRRKICTVYRNESVQKVIDDLQFILGFHYSYVNDSTITIN